MIVLKDVIVEI